jgi:hypothetical protein
MVTSKKEASQAGKDLREPQDTEQRPGPRSRPLSLKRSTSLSQNPGGNDFERRDRSIT